MEDCEELALATVKVEYEFWANNRTNISERTDKMLQSILDGHSLNNIEVFEMMRDDFEKVKKYAMIETLRQNISNSNGITLNDFNDLCSRIGFDLETVNTIRNEFEQRQLIIDDYKNSIHKK